MPFNQRLTNYLKTISRMILDDWARAWDINPQAIVALRIEYGLFSTDPVALTGSSEGAIQNKIRLEASKKGMRVWRNNVGACMDDNGNFIRYGLANDSKQMNDNIKSSDLIGLRPVVITREMVGRTFGLFIAREVKHSLWKWGGTPRERAQLKFIELVNSYGGDAAFATGEGTL